MDWIALRHVLLSHLPVASGLLLPWALLASQRPGRGIRPWWTVCRYLGWTGLLGLLVSLLSGFAAGRLQGLIRPPRLLPPQDTLVFQHLALGAIALLLAVGAVWAMNRPRKEHQSLGALALALGLAWSVVLLLAGASGFELAHGTPRRGPAAPMVTVAVPVLPPPAVVDPEAARPVRALDFAALEPIQAEAVKSTAHGGRWIRTWSSPAAAQAYRAGEPLPAGALVVVSSVEDRWGRPGTDPGPLYVLEMKAAGPALAFYWPRIPMDRRREFGGESQAYWREGHPGLEACRSCHRAGMADPTLRSRWRARRADAQD